MNPMSGTQDVPCTQGIVETKRGKRTSDRIDFDALCKLLKVDTWDKVDDRNIDCYWQWQDSMTEEENQKAEEDERDEFYEKYRDAVMFVAEQVFGEHGLILVPVRQLKENGRPYRHKGWKPESAWEFRITPKDSWKDAASHIRETIDGVGVFTFGTLRYFLSSGPYTAREAVLQHLGWIPDWYEVYEGGKAASRVERRTR